MRPAKRLVSIPSFLSCAPVTSFSSFPQHNLPQIIFGHFDGFQAKPLYLIQPHIITKHTLKPFLQDGIQTTQLIKICNIDAGHDRRVVVGKLDIPLIPLLLKVGAKRHGNGLCRMILVADRRDTNNHRARQTSKHELFETAALFVATSSPDPRFARLDPGDWVFEIGVIEGVDGFVEDGVCEHE